MHQIPVLQYYMYGDYMLIQCECALCHRMPYAKCWKSVQNKRVLFILVYFGLFWFILVYFGLFWFILVYFGLFWFILVYFGLFWFICFCGVIIGVIIRCFLPLSSYRRHYCLFFSFIASHLTQWGKNISREFDRTLLKFLLLINASNWKWYFIWMILW